MTGPPTSAEALELLDAARHRAARYRRALAVGRRTVVGGALLLVAAAVAALVLASLTVAPADAVRWVVGLPAFGGTVAVVAGLAVRSFAVEHYEDEESVGYGDARIKFTVTPEAYVRRAEARYHDALRREVERESRRRP